MSKVVLLPQGQHLFSEGDESKSVYLIKRGVLRIYKTRQGSQVDIETLKGGQIVGELALFANQPRSASAQALSECELIEVPQNLIESTLDENPEWFQILVRTMASRIRMSSNKIRLLEKPTTESSTDAFGNTQSGYRFVSIQDLLKYVTAKICGDLLYEKVGPLLGLSEAKSVAFHEAFRRLPSDVVARPFLEKFVIFLSDESKKSSADHRLLSTRGVLCAHFIAQNLAESAGSEIPMRFNLGSLFQSSGKAFAIPPLNLAEFQELVDKRWISPLEEISVAEIYTQINPVEIHFISRVHKIIAEFDRINESIQRKT